MVATKHVRDLVYAGPGEVVGELEGGLQHLVRRYRGVGGMEIYNKGENSEQEVASHGQQGDGRRGGKLFRGLLNI
jgi:hypothetical protein